jgi:DNA-directed RNA polymerase subunit RPC12/RpoP
MDDNYDPEQKCPECGIVDILDSEARVCYECWSQMDLKAAEEEE